MNKSLLQIILLILVITLLSIAPPGRKPLFNLLGGYIIDTSRNIIYFFWNFGQTVEDWGQAIFNFRQLIQDRISYQEAQELIKVLRVQNESFKRENQNLRDQWKMKQLPEDTNYLGARMIGTDFNLYNKALILDRGSQDRITEGSLLLYGQGIAGIVIKTFEKTSLAVLTNNENFVIGGMVADSGEMGVIRGGVSYLTMELLSLNLNVNPGQMVVSSAGEGMPNYPLGIIIQIDTTSPLTPRALIKPLVNPNEARHFLIILDNN